MSYFIGMVLILGGAAMIGFACFKYGYSLGWQERQRDMILPRNIVDRTNRGIDDNETHHRHSAIDPKKAMWH